MQKRYYSYDEFKKDVNSLSKDIEGFAPDTLLAIARGGLTLAHFLGIGLNTRRVFALNSIHYNGTKRLDTIEIKNIPNLSDAKRVLVLDDIVDSGDTAIEVLSTLRSNYPDVEFKLATIFYKPQAPIQPDFSLKEAKEWIDFFWEVDI